MSKPRKIKIKTLYLSGKGNKVFKNGDVTTEDQISGRNIDELIKGGHVEVIGGGKTEEKTEEKSEPVFVTEDGVEVFTGKEKGCTKNDIIAELEAREIEHDDSERKDALFALLK